MYEIDIDSIAMAFRGSYRTKCSVKGHGHLLMGAISSRPPINLVGVLFDGLVDPIP